MELYGVFKRDRGFTYYNGMSKRFAPTTINIEITFFADAEAAANAILAAHLAGQDVSDLSVERYQLVHSSMRPVDKEKVEGLLRPVRNQRERRYGNS